MEMYKLDFPNGKSYIGITSFTLRDRLKKHATQAEKAGSTYVVHRAFRKYGVGNVKAKTLLIADDWDYLCEAEKAAIRVYGTRSPGGYNLTDGGDGVLGRDVTQEERDKISHRMRAAWEDREFRENQVKKRVEIMASRPELREAASTRLKTLWGSGSIAKARNAKRLESFEDGTWVNPLTTGDSLVAEIYSMKDSGLTQCEVADLTEVGQQTISRIWNLKSPKGPLVRLGLVDKHGKPTGKELSIKR